MEVSGYFIFEDLVGDSTAGGGVVGPGVSVDEDVVVFDGTTGGIIKDSGVNISDIPRKSTVNTFSQENTFTEDLLLSRGLVDDIYTITPVGSTYTIDFTQAGIQVIDLTSTTGGITLAASNMVEGKTIQVDVIANPSSNNAIAFPAGPSAWTWYSNTPVTSYAGENTRFYISARGTGSGDVVVSSSRIDLSTYDSHIADTSIHFASTDVAGTSFPVSPYSGQSFYRTDLEDNFWYDSTLSKWLGSRTSHDFGFTANLGVGSWFKLAGNTTSSANSGQSVPYTATIVGYSYTQNAAVGSGNYRIYINGTGSTSFSHTAKSASGSLDIDVNANDVISVKNESGVSVAAPVLNLSIKRRAT